MLCCVYQAVLYAKQNRTISRGQIACIGGRFSAFSFAFGIRYGGGGASLAGKGIENFCIFFKNIAFISGKFLRFGIY